MLPGNGLGDTDKTCFTTDVNYKFKYGSEGLNTTDIKEYIRNPHKFNTKPEMDGRYYNLWSTDNDKTVPNDEVVIKSVYDPSPVGYSLPASNAFTGFTTTGQRIDNRPNPFTPETKAKFNVKGEFDKGYYFYTKPNKTGGTIFFPANGFRWPTTGIMSYVYKFSNYASAIPRDSSYEFCLHFGQEFIAVHNGSTMADGKAVRSAEEKIKKHHSLNIPINNFIF